MASTNSDSATKAMSGVEKWKSIVGKPGSQHNPAPTQQIPDWFKLQETKQPKPAGERPLFPSSTKSWKRKPQPLL